MTGPWKPVLEGADARRCASLLAGFREDLEAAALEDLGSALGQVWMALHRPEPGGQVAAESALDGVIRRLAELPSQGVLADSMALLLTRERLRLLTGGPDRNGSAEAMYLQGLRNLPGELDPLLMAWVVQVGRFFLWRVGSRPEPLRVWLEVVARHCRAWVEGPFLPLGPHLGWSGLLAVALDGCARLEVSSAPFLPMLGRILQNGLVTIDAEGQMSLGAPWLDEVPGILDDPRNQQPRIRLSGHLGVWTLLLRLQADHPEVFDPPVRDLIHRQVDFFGRFSYLIHVRIGYKAGGVLEPSLLIGGAGALQCFNRLYQITGEDDHGLNAQLWARHLMDLLEMDSQCRVRTSRMVDGKLAHPVDHSLAHGGAGVWLALHTALHGGEPVWQDLVF